MAFNEWPKTLYRYDENGEKAGKTFNAAEDAEAGWLSVEEFSALPVPAKKAAPVENGGARHRELVSEIAAIKKDREGEAKISADMIAAKDDVIQAQGDEIVALRAFVGQLRDDPKCPAELKAAIDDLLGDGEPAKAAAKPKRAKA